MEKPLPKSIPQLHQELLDRAVEELAQQSWLIGIAALGSFATDTMDVFSDLDLTLAVEEKEYTAVLENRLLIAETLGPLLSAFTGEHAGEPRLLLCLYGPPLLHVDFVFKTLPDVAERVDEFIVLWERDERLSTTLKHSAFTASQLDPQWVEDRFWVWIHKACGKIGRGELFEAIEYLAFLRKRVLGPLCLQQAGQRPNGLRYIEAATPALAEDLKATLASHSARECLIALGACIELYRRLRASELQYRQEAERAVMNHLNEMGDRTNTDTGTTTI